MSNFSLTLEPFGGATIINCANEAVSLANHLQLTIMFNFNEVNCMACPGDDANSLASEYFKELKKEGGYKFARGQK
jgi:hypothetical protein